MMLDAQTFSDWGIDLLKFDTCNSDAHDNKFGNFVNFGILVVFL